MQRLQFSPSQAHSLIMLLLCFGLNSGFGQLIAQLEVTHAKCHGLRGKVHVASVSGGKAPYYYSLDGANFSTNPGLPQLPPGDYILHIRDDYGNVGQMPFTIQQPELLEAEIFTSKSIVAPREEFEVNVRISPADAQIVSIKWRPDHVITVQDTTDHKLSILHHTTLFVEVRNSENCIAYAYKEVRVHDSDLYFPNAISPRSSDNEIFTLYGGSRVRLVKEMTIVDRVGTVMFSKTNLIPNDTSAGWNGRSKDKAVLPGVYYYQCKLEMEDGTTQIVSGDVTVMY